MADCMSRDQFMFIFELTDKMQQATNMTPDEAWDFAFRVWQFQDYLREYLKEDK